MMAYIEYISTPEAVWFPSVPNTWRATKMRELFSERNTKVSDKDYPALSVGKMGVVPQLDTAVKTDNGDNRKLILQGDFAINSRSDRKGAGGISVYDGSASLIITVLKPHHELNGRFYHYLLRSHYFSEEFFRNGHGLVSDLWTTKWDTMRNIYIPVPPREEQDQIVRYLDWQLSKINKLIHGYQREIKLLEERKRTLVDKAVTKGLTNTAEMKSSGAHWLGEIPKGWKTRKIGELFKQRNDKVSDEDFPPLSVGYMGVVPQLENAAKTDNGDNRKLICKGDFAVNSRSDRKGACGLSEYDGSASLIITVFYPKQEVVGKFFHFLFRCHSYVEEFYRNGHGLVSDLWTTNWNDMKSIVVPVPPLDEQQEILEYIEAKTNQLNILKDRIAKQIECLKEYRTRLISDVVTGQVDVRGIEIPDYEVEADVDFESEAGENDDTIGEEAENDE